VRTNGSDRGVHTDESDLGAQSARVFDWSPDGGGIVLVRGFMEGYEELFTFRPSEEAGRQRTIDQKNIGDVSWGPNDAMLFSSDRGGNANVWMIPGSGGNAVQLTKGSGPDLAARASADGRRLVYVQRESASRIWKTDPAGSSSAQVMIGEHDVRAASLSPDGSMLALEIADPNPLRHSRRIYTASSDGTNLRPFTPADILASDPAWSPDGSRIAFLARGAREPEDSVKLRVAEANQAGPGKALAHCESYRWYDAGSLLAYDARGTRYLQLGGEETAGTYYERTHAIPVARGEAVLYEDLRPERAGWWLGPTVSDTFDPSVIPDSFFIMGPVERDREEDSRNLPLVRRGFAVRLPVPPGAQVSVDAQRGWLTYIDRNGTVNRVSYEEGAVSKLQVTFPGGRARLAPSSGSASLLAVESRHSAKLILVDSPFSH
jgi:dipeptidyl aminopeptidase/acylaminoacyl peptidase